MPLSCQKHRFALELGVHYLNGVAYSPGLLSGIAHAAAGFRLKAATPFAIAARDHFDTADRIRWLFAELIGGNDPERVAWVPAVSYGMATVAQNLHRWPGIGAKKEIILIGEEFPNNVYAFERVCAALGLSVKTVDKPDSPADRGARWNERLLEAIGPETALVVASQVHWIYGTVFDLAALGERCRAVGAMLAVDATQSVGVMPFDVQAIQPDAVICAAYKWLLGPYGIAVGWYGPFFDGGVPIEENWMNREESDHFAGLTRYTRAYRPKAQRYNGGEFSQFAQLPVLEDSLRQILEWGVAEMQAYCRELSKPAIPRWEALGCGLDAPDQRAAHLFGLSLPAGVDTAGLVGLLTGQRVYVSLRGGALRVSLNVYNDAADVEALTAALETLMPGR